MVETHPGGRVLKILSRFSCETHLRILATTTRLLLATATRSLVAKVTRLQSCCDVGCRNLGRDGSCDVILTHRDDGCDLVATGWHLVTTHRAGDRGSGVTRRNLLGRFQRDGDVGQVWPVFRVHLVMLLGAQNQLSSH
ncbi:hypothetical protein L484_011082 [Morus notabilis]|uniref:Uncharacterized protein n=1 Tax=Morus notabilis TaxID=981085 RepID=W9SA87_9ROSA|nr:hypothetical protein L484_011082 [Morus notabilis]